MNRRSFLSGIIAAPAIVRIDSLMALPKTGWYPATGVLKRTVLLAPGIYLDEYKNEEIIHCIYEIDFTTVIRESNVSAGPLPGKHPLLTVDFIERMYRSTADR